MKVVAVVNCDQVMVQMSTAELAKIAGFDSSYSFDKAFGSEANSSRVGEVASSLLKIDDIPVSEIYGHAKDTLGAYEELRTKFESVRNQLSTLLKRMESLNPAPKEEK